MGIVRTAGDTYGTPDWQLDRMREIENDRIWAAQNTETDGETLRQGAKALGYAINELDGACDCVNEAAELLVDTPEGDRVSSILDDMEKLLEEIRQMQKKWGAV